MSASLVAQIVNLRYRRLAIGGAGAKGLGERFSGLTIRDTADCRSALPREAVELLAKEEGVQK